MCKWAVYFHQGWLFLPGAGYYRRKACYYHEELVTDVQISYYHQVWQAMSNYLLSYSILINKPSISSCSGFRVRFQDLAGLLKVMNFLLNPYSQTSHFKPNWLQGQISGSGRLFQSIDFPIKSLFANLSLEASGPDFRIWQAP